MVFDPVVANKLYFSEGIGVWYTNPPSTYVGFNWYSQSAGIEQLVANEIVSPPGGNPLVASWDRPVFDIGNPAVYPSTHGPDNQYPIIAGWGIDYATTNPNFVVGLMERDAEKSGYSSDGGKTWSPFASYPPAGYGGCIAASTPSNIIWVQSNNGNPYVTQNGGMAVQLGRPCRTFLKFGPLVSESPPLRAATRPFSLPVGSATSQCILCPLLPTLWRHCQKVREGLDLIAFEQPNDKPTDQRTTVGYGGTHPPLRVPGRYWLPFPPNDPLCISLTHAKKPHLPFVAVRDSRQMLP